MLEFNIRNQEISRIDNFSPAEKSVGYLEAKFNFKTEDWNGAVKRAIFRNVKSKLEKDTMLEDDSCMVPWEILVGSSDIEVSVHGVIDTKDITTDVAVFNLDRTLSGGSASQEPSPTVYEQMLKEMQETKEIAQSVRDDADAGKFNGKDGESGTGKIDEEQLLQFAIKKTTEKAEFLNIQDSAKYKVLDFGMEGITEQYTGTITDDGGNEITVPNPTHPQEIKLAGVLNEETGRYEHKCCVGNKNIWNPQSKNIYQIYTGWKVKDNTNKAITVTLIDKNNGADISGVYFGLTGNGINANAGVLWLINNGVQQWRTYTTDKYNYITIYSSSGTTNALNKLFNRFDVIVEYGVAFTSYTPHASQPLTLTSDRPLTMWDKLVKRDGVWGCGIKGKKRIFDGTEEWFQDGKMVRLLRWDDGKTLKHSNAQVLGFYSNIAIEGTGASGSEIDYTFSTHNYLGVDWILFKFEIAVDDWKAYLAEQYANGTPVYVQYHTAEEQAFIPLPDEEQELLRNLEMYYGVTNVYNEQGCPMWLTYVADPKLYVDKKLLEIQSAMI